MRKVKFRVWNKNNKEYIVPEQFEILLLSNDNETPVYKLNLNNNIYEFYKAENIEVEMFTGLKDKYEKDFYEGDIIYSYISRLIQHYDSEIELESDTYFFEEFEEFVVIGNIHETKEFLK